MYFICYIMSFRGTGSSDCEDRRTPSSASWCSPTVSGGSSSSKIGSCASDKNRRRACGEEGPVPRGKAHPSTSREADSYYDREARAGAGHQAVSHKDTRVQNDLPPCEEALNFSDSL